MTDVRRRDVLRYSAAGAVTTATALYGVQALTGTEPAEGKPRRDPRDFDEDYRGKRIRGRHFGRGRDELHVNDKPLALTEVSTLFVPEDGSAPYVAVGYISAINHYDPVEIDDVRTRDGLRRLGRRIVDRLGGLDLSDEAGKGHSH